MAIRRNRFVIISALIIFGILLFLLIKSSYKKDEESTYGDVLRSLISKNNLIVQILYKGKEEKYKNKIIKLYGYVDRKKSIMFSSGDFLKGQPDNTQIMNYIDLIKDNIDQPVNFEGCEYDFELMEVHGKFQIISNQKFVLKNITEMYEFDDTPIHEGGQGKRHQCKLNP